MAKFKTGAKKSMFLSNQATYDMLLRDRYSMNRQDFAIRRLDLKSNVTKEELRKKFMKNYLKVILRYKKKSRNKLVVIPATIPGRLVIGGIIVT